MSLVNEALRKARQEAAELQAEERATGKRDGNAAYRPPRAHLPEQSKLGMGLMIGILLGVLAAAGGGFAVWLALSTDEPISQASSQVSPETSSEPIAPPPASPPVSPPPTPTPEVTAAAPSMTSAPMTSAPMNSPADRETRAATAEIALSSSEPSSARADQITEPAETTASQPSLTAPSPMLAEPPAEEDKTVASEAESELPKLIQPPGSVGQVGDTNVFVLEAKLDDTTLTLDFIAWNPSAPFAQINGRQVEVGQLVEGLLVERIDRNQVTLKALNSRIVLRVR